MRSRKLIDPFPDLSIANKHHRATLFFIVWRYLRNHVGSEEFHHVIDDLINPFFLSIHR